MGTKRILLTPKSFEACEEVLSVTVGEEGGDVSFVAAVRAKKETGKKVFFIVFENCEGREIGVGEASVQL